MKTKKLASVLLIAAFVLSANLVFAQNKDFMKKTPEERAQKRADKMRDKLALSEEQHKQVYNALLSQAQQMDDMRSKNFDKSEKKEQMKSIWQNTDLTISGILKSDQLTKYNKYKEERKQKHMNKKKMKHQKKDKGKQ